MFEYVDKHKRIAQVVLSIITLTFVFFGTYSYFQRSSTLPEVADVGGDKVTQQEFDQAIRDQQQRMQAQLKENYDPTMFDSPEVRFAIVDQLVNQKLLDREATADRLRVTDGQLQGFIMSIPAFQEDGKFSADRYKLVLSGQDMTPASFEQRLRSDMRVAPLQEPIAAGSVVAKPSVERYLTLLEQKREVATATIPVEPFLKDVKIDDAAVRKFYDDNQAALKSPEQVKLEYLVLSPDTLASKAAVTPEEVKARYDSNLAAYGQPEERSASHILIAVKPDASAAEKAAAKKKAEDIAAQVRANPGKFAEIAKAQSEDPGSAPQGGDLGSFAHDTMVKPFADAAFAAKVGDIVGPVQTDFGWHVIKVTGITPAKVKPFDEVKGDIEKQLKAAKIQQQFGTEAEKFQNLVYEQADSLQGVAKAMGLTVQTTPFLARAQVQQLAQNNVKFADAVFAPDSLTQKRNTDAIEIAPNTLMAGRVVDSKPAAVRPFDEVKDEIRRQLQRREAVALAQKAGAEKLAALEAGKSDKDVGLAFGKPVDLTRNQVGPGMPPDALVHIFQVNEQKLPGYIGATNAQGGYSIYRVTKVTNPPALDDDRLKTASSRLSDQVGRELMTAYLASLRARTDVQINQAALDKKPQQ
ncbi:MAG: SurA N-terminal domain-containing protein [Proteobacteria bacterium]|nr:SurA N-terminal domain-containing protein [Pseudomonadota bacterium]